VFAHGSYQGSVGVFLWLREDAIRAPIAEPNGSIRGHPVEWRSHSEVGLPLRYLANHDETGTR
jgi:hypothetical protein